MPTQSNAMVFEHSSAPATVKPSGHTKAKYRGEDETPLPLSSDPRVMRGSTTAIARKIAANKNFTRKKAMSRSIDESEFGRQLPRSTYQFEVKGHVGPDIDLSPYLIAKDDGIIPKQKEIVTQTDKFKDRPTTPDYVPKKTGIDNTTQVDDVRELFDFNQESEPIVNVIVSKTLDQALFEVLHEQELIALELMANEYHNTIQLDNEWKLQREKDTINEINEHKNELINNEKKRNFELKLMNQVGGQQCIKQILPDIINNAIESLYEDKIWLRPEREDIELNYIHDIRDKNKNKYKANGESKKIIDELLEEACKRYSDATDKIYQKPDARMCLLHFDTIIPLNSNSNDDEEKPADDIPIPNPKIDPVKLWGPITCIDVYNECKKLCIEKDITMYENVTILTIQHYFVKLIGRPIAIDAAIMNFEKYLPNEEYIFPI